MSGLWSVEVEEQVPGIRLVGICVYDGEPTELGWEYVHRHWFGEIRVTNGDGPMLFGVNRDNMVVSGPVSLGSFEGMRLEEYLTMIDKQLGGIVSISAKYRSGRSGLPSGVFYINGKRVDFDWSVERGGEPVTPVREYTKSEQLVMDRLKELYKKMNKG